MDLLERLGLGGRRVLILHHDDLGLTHAQNGAYQALGLPTGSVMVPGACLLYTSPSPRDGLLSRMPSSA